MKERVKKKQEKKNCGVKKTGVIERNKKKENKSRTEFVVQDCQLPLLPPT